MDDFKTVSDDEANLVGEKVYYKALPITNGSVLVNTEQTFDVYGKPLVSSEVYNGIKLREVNKLKGNK